MLIHHFIRYTCSTVCQHKSTISQSHGNTSVHLGMKTWFRPPVEVQTMLQNGEERWFKRCQMAWPEYYRNCWSTHPRFSWTSISLGFIKKKAEKGKISGKQQFSGPKCLVDAKSERKAAVTEITTGQHPLTPIFHLWIQTHSCVCVWGGDFPVSYSTCDWWKILIQDENMGDHLF